MTSSPREPIVFSLEEQEKGAQRPPASIVYAITEPRRRRLVRIVRRVAY